MLQVMLSSLQKRRDRFKKNKKGFTLIELIVVIAILAILMAILIPSIGGMIGNAKHTSAVSDARTIFVAAEAVAQQRDAAGTSLGTSTNVYSTGSAATGVIIESDMSDTLGTTFMTKITAASPSIAIKGIYTDGSGHIVGVVITETGVKGDDGTTGDPVVYPQSASSALRGTPSATPAALLE